jgi:hypothetical protein
MLRIFYTEKIQRLRPGLKPGIREPEDSMLATRPPKPSYPTTVLLSIYVPDDGFVKKSDTCSTFRR